MTGEPPSSRKAIAMSRTASASSILPVLAAGVVLNVFGGLTHGHHATANPTSPPAKVAELPAASAAHAGPAGR